MIEGAFVVAMGVVLSYVIIFKLPWGGAITLLSMLPVGIYSIKYGVKKGLMISFVFSLSVPLHRLHNLHSSHNLPVHCLAHVGSQQMESVCQ